MKNNFDEIEESVVHVQPLTGRVAWAKKEEKGKGYHPPVPRLVARVNMIGSGPILGKRSKFFGG